MNWKQQLKELKYTHMERTAPGFFAASGGRSMTLNPYRDTTANGLTKCIIELKKMKQIIDYAVSQKKIEMAAKN